MSKVFKINELKTTNDRVQYSESYEVNFHIQKTDGFWERRSETYRTANKSDHKDVELRWRKDFKNDNVTLISVIYQ